jgi:hypothetical protein
MAGVGFGLIRTWVGARGDGSHCSKAAGIQPCATRSVAGLLVGLAVCAASVPARAQYPAEAATGALPPTEILLSVRSAGFHPLSRPVQRGAVYTLIATDRYLFDLRLTVDARSGRVLTATRLAGASRGGPVYEGTLPSAYPFYDGGQRVPIPPALVPVRRNAATAASAPQPPQLPLPRSRPGNGVAAVPAAAAQGEQSTAAVQPLQPEQPPASPQRPDMVPIAPF